VRDGLCLSTGLHWVSVDAVVSCLWIILLSVTVSSLVWVVPAGSLATAETGGDRGLSVVCLTQLYHLHLVSSRFPDRNPNVAMGASFSAPEYSIKVTDVAKVRTLNAIAKNIL